MKRMTIQQKVIECLRLSMEVTENTKHTVFFNYQAHVQEVSIAIHIGGWQMGKSAGERFECYISDGCKRNAHQELNKAISKLKSLQS